MTFPRKKLLLFVLICVTHIAFGQNVIICNGEYAYAWHSTSNCSGLANCKGSITTVSQSYAQGTLNRSGCCICTTDPKCSTDNKPNLGSNQLSVPQSWNPNTDALLNIGNALQDRYYQNSQIIVNEVLAIENLYYLTKQKPLLSLNDKELLDKIFKNFIANKEHLRSYDYSKQSNLDYTYSWAHNHYILIERIYYNQGSSITSVETNNTIRHLPDYGTLQEISRQKQIEASTFPIIQYYYISRNFSYFDNDFTSGISLGFDLEWSNKHFISMSVDELNYCEAYNIGIKQLSKNNMMLGMFYSFGTLNRFPDYPEFRALTFSAQKNIALSKHWYFIPKISYSTKNMLIIDAALSYRINKIFLPLY